MNSSALNILKMDRKMARNKWLVLCVLVAASGTLAQSRKPMTNQDIVTMTKEGLTQPIIVKAIETSYTNFDLSAQALGDLQAAGVSEAVVEAMLATQTKKPAGGNGLVPVGDPASANATPSNSLCAPVAGGEMKCTLREGTEVPLKFTRELSSKTANEGDSVELTLDEDIKVGNTVVAKKGAQAVGTVSNAKKAGMMGKGGELNIQLVHLVVGDNRVHIRGAKGREGDSKVGATVALTVLFGPIGLIKHGKNVEVPAGTPLMAYVDQDISLPAIE
jgi:hypothetical protein